MNLHDMLIVDDGPAVMFPQDGDADPFMGEAVTSAEPPLSLQFPENNAYYFPVTLSQTQTELTEMLLQLFKKDISEHAQALRPRTSIQSLLDDSPQGQSSCGLFERFESLFDLLVKVARHPSLMVDHFFPQKLLLLMTNESVVNMSGKMCFLNSLLDFYTDHTTKDEFHMVIVALSNKELELVEGLIIGKPLVHTSLNNLKFFDHGPYEAKPGLNVHLVTSQQLRNNFMSFLQSKQSDEPFKLIFSLDLDLDVKSPSIDLIQSEGERVPILIPIPIFSIEHLKHIVPPPTHSFNQYKDPNTPLCRWKMHIIDMLVCNRHWCYDEKLNSAEFIFREYGTKMVLVEGCVNQKNTRLAHVIDNYDAKIDLKVLEHKLTDEINKTFVKLDLKDVSSCDLFKSALAQVSLRRVAYINEETHNIRKQNLVLRRQQELKRQLEIDEGIDKIAETFIKLRKTNEEAEAGEKKLARAEDALLKAERANKEKTLQLSFLQSADLVEGPSPELIEQQQKQLHDLETETKDLEIELNRLVQEGETSRREYQEKLSEAVGRAATLTHLKNQDQTTKSQIKSMAPNSLLDLTRHEAVRSRRESLTSMQHDQAFIERFMEKQLVSVAQARKKLLSSTASTSTGRLNNRISRALTPHG